MGLGTTKIQKETIRTLLKDIVILILNEDVSLVRDEYHSF